LIVDGHAVSWQRLCELRRLQLAAWKAAQCEQPALFDLQDDCRPWPSGPLPGGIRSRVCFDNID